MATDGGGATAAARREEIARGWRGGKEGAPARGRGSERGEEGLGSAAFISWESDWSHWIGDGRLKTVGLFGLKWTWFA